MADYTCTCTPCSECRGSGSVWYDLTGRYLGARRSDDLDTLDTCDECGGSGITDECDKCMACEDEVANG